MVECLPFLCSRFFYHVGYFQMNWSVQVKSEYVWKWLFSWVFVACFLSIKYSFYLKSVHLFMSFPSEFNNMIVFISKCRRASILPMSIWFHSFIGTILGDWNHLALQLTNIGSNILGHLAKILKIDTIYTWGLGIPVIWTQ